MKKNRPYQRFWGGDSPQPSTSHPSSHIHSNQTHPSFNMFHLKMGWPPGYEMNRTCKNSITFRSNMLIFRGCILNIGSTTPPTTRIINNFEFGIPKLNLRLSHLLASWAVVGVGRSIRRMLLFQGTCLILSTLHVVHFSRAATAGTAAAHIAGLIVLLFPSCRVGFLPQMFLKKKTLGKKLNKWCLEDVRVCFPLQKWWSSWNVSLLEDVLNTEALEFFRQIHKSTLHPVFTEVFPLKTP